MNRRIVVIGQFAYQSKRVTKPPGIVKAIRAVPNTGYIIDLPVSEEIPRLA